jgi:predicted amidohydrolase YtcJ
VPLTTLFRGGRVHNPVEPNATCIAITDGVVSWIGPEHGIEQAGHVDETVDLDGAFVAPAFIDAHVHVTDAGLASTGLDLRTATSVTDILDRLRAHVVAHPAGVVWGHGWDETSWPERRAPTRAEVDAVVGNRPAYLSRVDVHSAVISTALGVGAPVDGGLTGSAHHEARALARNALTGEDRRRAQLGFFSAAAAAGIVEVHECAYGDPAGRADLAALLSLDGPVAVRAYLGVAVSDPAEAKELLAASGSDGLGGDLCVDGSFGSHTASLTSDYADAPGTGRRYLTTVEITDHLVACATAGIQPGFHAIGDDAVDAVAEGLRRAAERLGGTLPLAAVTPRIEHAEFASADAVSAIAGCGAVASVQPLFDALWGGPDGMYADRLGGRAAALNPFARLASAGVTLAFGSDAPVTPADPWAAVRAAVQHRTAGFGVTPRAAFTAHTRGAHRAAQRLDRGVITIGAVADLAFWQAGALVRPEAAEMVQRWSTDPRSRVPLLPDLSPGAELPRCLATVAGGVVTYDGGLLASSRLPRHGSID